MLTCWQLYRLRTSARSLSNARSSSLVTLDRAWRPFGAGPAGAPGPRLGLARRAGAAGRPAPYRPRGRARRRGENRPRPDGDRGPATWTRTGSGGGTGAG